MRITIALAALGAAAAALSANPAAAEENSFTGPRVELLAGYDVIEADAPVAGADDSLDAVHARIQAGYDLPLGETWRVGLEAGFGWNLDGSNEYVAGGTRTELESRHDIDVSLRLGAKVSDRTFLYAKGGWANTGFRARSVAGAVTTTVKDDEDGWRAGFGIEHMLGERLYAKAEYRYTDYGHDLSRHQALLGVGYRF